MRSLGLTCGCADVDECAADYVNPVDEGVTTPRWPGQDGLALQAEPGGRTRVWGRVGFAPYELVIDEVGGVVEVSDGVVDAVMDGRTFAFRSAGDGPPDHRLDLSAAAILTTLARAVLDPARPNPVNAPMLDCAVSP